MTVFIITVHVIVCALLIALILIQRGRGGGLVESFSGVESMFGTKTSTFLTRSTTILSIIFFGTCLSLALIAAQQSRSLMRDVKQQKQTVKETPAAKETITQTPEPEVPISETSVPAPVGTEALAPESAPTPAVVSEQETSTKISTPEKTPETQGQ